jgi:RNA polymerase sigma factor (sigma-70 family)
MGVLQMTMTMPGLGVLPRTARGRTAAASAVAPRGTLLPSEKPACAALGHEAERRLQRTPEQQFEIDAARQESLQLVRQCIAGDQQAWQQLVAAQHRRIYGICYRFTGSASDAEDLTQDVFLKVYRNLGTFDGQKGHFNTWLTTLARNLLVDNFRRTRLERATDSLDACIAGDEDARGGGFSRPGRYGLQRDCAGAVYPGGHGEEPDQPGAWGTCTAVAAYRRAGGLGGEENSVREQYGGDES